MQGELSILYLLLPHGAQHHVVQAVWQHTLAQSEARGRQVQGVQSVGTRDSVDVGLGMGWWFRLMSVLGSLDLWQEVEGVVV